MPQPEMTAIERRLKQLKIVRAVAAIAAMLAIGAVVCTGIVALTKEEDSWQAMRLPLMTSIACLWIFARCAKAIADGRERLSQ